MEENGKKISQRTGGSLVDIAKSKGSQQTQGNSGLTDEQQNLKDWTKNKLQEQGILPGINQGTQTATTTTTLPGITKLQNLQESNKIQFGSNVKSNIILPGISEPKYPNATLSQATQETEKEGNKRANDNVKDTRSMNEEIHDEMVKGEYIPLLKQGAKQTWNDIKKFGYRKGIEIVDDLANRPYETILGGIPHYKLLGKYLDNNITNNLDTKPLVDKSMNVLWNKYYKYEDKINKNFDKWVDQNMNKIIAKEYQDSGGVWESIKSGNTDMIKYGLMQGFSTSVIPMIPGIIAGIVTKNPTVTASIAFASTAPIEDQEAYEEAMKEGATRDEATQIGRYAGIINGTLETVGEFLQLKGLLKPLKKNITKEITKKTTRQIISRGLLERNKGVFGEALTEGTQEFVTNALIKTINENKDIFEGVIDSMIVGGVLGGGGSTLGAGGKVIEDVENNKKIDLATDIEALNYVMQGEERKAQRMQQKQAEQREKIKQKILSRRKANTWGEVEEIDNKFQKTEEENSGFSSRNEYSEGRNIGWEKDENLSTNSMYVSDITISENSSQGDRMTTDSFFETDENGEYIEYDDGSRKERIYAGGNKTNKNGSIKSQFTEKSKGTPRTPKLKKYYDNFNRLVKNLSNPNVKVNDYVQIGKTGKGKNIYLSKGVLAHIIEDHGVFDVNTLIESVNNPTGQKWESETTKTRQGGHGTRPYMEYDIGSEDSEIIVGIKPDSWEKDTDTAEYYGVVSMRESNAPTTPADNVKFQLKYEEKGYTPGVANKKEKNISGKEGIKQKNTINDETIEQLAEKYGVKVEVIKGMIEILRKGKREGYAYGKYRDQLLTLSEQIKESTAPHELLHAIFDMIDPETKTYLIAQVMKSEGWNAETAEERLADSFSNFFRTGKIEGAPKSTWGRIKIFFKRVRSFINGMNKWRNELDEIFTDIITADGIVDLQSKIDESSRLNKSKEKMRKRFMEYRKNAQKMQKKTESENKYQRVYHGSPAEFERFDSSHMGEGEGAQAHGWGHYVAIDEKTGRHYADMGGGPAMEIKYKGNTIKDLLDNNPENNQGKIQVMSHMEDGMSFDKARNATIMEYRNWNKNRKDMLKNKTRDPNWWTEENLIKAIKAGEKLVEDAENLKEEDIKAEIRKNRNLYEVEIPDPVKADTPTGSNYLEEDKPLSKNDWDKLINIFDDNLKERFNDYGKSMLSHLGNKGSTLYKFLDRSLGGPKQASKYLESLGYDGIHYFGLRDGEAYVIFNDDALEIKNHEKYQKAGDINSPAFKKRFGDSKVVDENGNPLVVYHGTADKFTVFDRKFDGKNTGNNGLYGNGFYFTNDIETAKFYGGKRMDLPLSDYDNDFVKRDKAKGEKSNIMGVYLKMEKPFYWKSIKNANQVRKLMNLIHVRGLKWNDYLKEMRTIVDDEQAINFRKGLDNAGYDGIIYEGDNGNEYAVFYPNQIKSATDNVGTYDANNDDIRYQKADSDQKDNEGRTLSNGQAEYFKDSKIRDKDGNLLRVYHGTRGGDFTVFKGGKTWSNSLAKVGYWFTPSKKGALKFAEGSWGADGKPRAEEVYLNITNPKIYEPSEFNLLSNEEKEKARDEQRKVYNQKANKADGLDYTKAGGFFHDEFDHPYNERTIFEYLKRSWDNDRKYDGKYGKYDPEKYRRLAKDNNVDFDKILKDFEEYTKAKLDEEKEYTKLLDMKYDDPYENFQYDIYKIDSNYDNNWTKADLQMALNDYESPNKFREKLISEGYDGIIIKGTEYDGEVIGGGARNDQYVAFYSNQIKRTTNLNPTDNDDIRYQRVYHGSPYDFDRFDSSHMGEGEGAQAHGWGHYVAVDENTGRRYAQLHQGDLYSNIKYKGESSRDMTRRGIDREDVNQVAPSDIMTSIVDGISRGKYDESMNVSDIAKDIINQRIEVYSNSYERSGDWIKNAETPEEKAEMQRRADRLRDLIKAYKDLDEKDFDRPQRNLYEVEIPDPVKADTPTGSNYLEENGEITKAQMDKIYDEVVKEYEKKKQGKAKRVQNLQDGRLKTFRNLIDQAPGMLSDGKGLYSTLSNVLGGQEQASKFLESLGYDGIHYFGGRDGEAYVIFNDDALEIKNHEKYQKAGDINSPAFKKRFGNSKVVDENGNPLVVYHGSRHAGFTQFKPVNTMTDGLWFFSDKRDIAGYFGGGIELWSDKGLKEEFENAKSRGIEAVKEFAVKYLGDAEKMRVNKNYISPKEAKKFGVDAGYTYTIDNGTVSSPIRKDGKRIFEKPLSQSEIDNAIINEIGESVEYSERGEHKNSRVYASYLSLKNPIIVDAKGEKFFEVRSPFSGKKGHIANIAYEAIDKGYDGAIIKNVSESPEYDLRGTVYIVGKPSQIKSATDNVGTYDPNNDDIRFQKAGNTKSANFKKRFDGSKVVKENGKPQIVYHGTTAEFTVFNKIASRGIFGDGYYFTNRIGTAREYGYGRDGRVMKVYLAIKNPYVADNGDGYFLNTEKLKEEGYDGVQAIMGSETYWVAFDSNQIKSATDNVGTYDPNNDDIRYQITEYEYDENGNRKWIKFGDNSEFDPNIFGTPTKEEQIEEDKENEKSNPFYNAWMKYNNQNYKDDQLTLGEFVDAVGAWGERKQEEFDKRKNDIAEVENDPKMLELQLKAVKLAEEETNVGKKFGKNVSKEVRDRQQAEVEKKREDLSKEIFEWMYPGLRFEEATYDDTNSAWNKEAEWEMLGRENIEEKLKYFKKDSNGNWEKKNIKLETPQEQREKIERSGNFDEVIAPSDRVIQWETPEGQKGRLDKAKDPKQFKKVMEKINSGKSKTKVELKDVTNEVRALERYRENEKAEKERRKKEKQEEYAKKKQEEYKRNVRLKAFQRLVDMQRFEKYPFLSEDEIKQRWGFTDDEWKKITEQLDLGYPPKKRNEKAVSDFNKAVDSEVKFIIEGLSRQNNMKQKEAEKNLGEIGDIDLDVLLSKDEEKGQKEVEEFERIAKEEKKKSKKEKNKRLEQAREDVTNVEIDKERENSKSEKERVDKIIKSTKSDNTVWGSIKKTASDIITPVSTRIREISPKIYRELMRYFQNKDILTNQRLKEIDPFLKAMGKIRKENPVRFMDIWVALANRNIGYANGLLQEYGVKVPTKLLDTIFDEAEDVGLNINYLGSYYPLSVKAPKSFMEELMKTGKGDIASEIEKKIQQESQKKGGPLDESEITAIINSVIAGEEKGPDVNTGNKHLKKRNTEIERTPKMLEYCDDPISTLIGYIEGMTQSIERAKFLGKSRSGNVHTLADYVYNAKNGLTAEQQDELMDLLKSVFNDASPNKFYQTWRDIATLTTLGSPSSTLTQIGDLSFSIYENGWREALKATWDIFMKRKAFDLKDMGVINRGEEYTNINSQKNLLQKAIHNVFKLTFFSNFDTFGKSTFIQSTWNKRRKRALKGENGDPQLIKDIMKITDDEYTTIKIINDLRNGVFSEDVALVMYMKLGDIQPLTKAQMPKAYLDNPNGRLFYQFKTFGIKQLDYVLQETKEQTRGFKNLSTTEKFLRVAQIANMIFIMTLMGAGASELKDITMRRRSNSLILRWLFGEEVGSEQIWDKIGDSALQLFGLSRYTVMQMKSDPVDAITNLFTTFPATNLITYPFKDINKAFKDDGSINWRNPSAYQLIPVIGKYRYWIYGGGQDKQQEALDKEKKTTTSGGSSRSTRTTRNTRSSRSRRNTR